MSAQIHIGTSGYHYDHWKGVFYPKDLAKKDWFAYYAGHFDSLEINNTFYKMPKAETFDEWRKAAPKDFVFAIKYSRYGTHRKKLKDPEDHVSYLLDRASHLADRLGPFLVQLPPNWNKNAQRLEEFLSAAPKKHRWAVEIRNEDWLCDEIYDILRRYNAALVIHDMIDDHPHEVTADWLYMRFHGKNYSGNYSEKQLKESAQFIKKQLKQGRDSFAYFNNDLEGHAVQNALDLRELCQ